MKFGAYRIQPSGSNPRAIWPALLYESTAYLPHHPSIHHFRGLVLEWWNWAVHVRWDVKR